jgi:hypothetical protein
MIRLTSAALLVAGVLIACGGKTTGQGSSSGDSPGSPGRSGDAGPCGGAAVTCVEIDPDTYDQSCRVDSDCVEVTTGPICTGQCACPTGSVINVSEKARYDEAVSAIAFEACPCPSDGVPRCVKGFCALCGLGPNDGPPCPDAG